MTLRSARELAETWSQGTPEATADVVAQVAHMTPYEFASVAQAIDSMYGAGGPPKFRHFLQTVIAAGPASVDPEDETTLVRRVEAETEDGSSRS